MASRFRTLAAAALAASLVACRADAVPQPAVTRLQVLVPAGHVLRLQDGTRWTAIETSDFQLYQKFLAGIDVRAILRQRADLGFNLVRVFGMARNLFDLNPVKHPSYYAQLGPFCELLESYGLR